jgi:DnaK suppressor protein
MQAQEGQWIRALRDRGLIENSTSGDEGDSAASDEGLELTASLAELAGNRAVAVESALRRFREGSYGICEECGEEIPVERLRALPAAVLCVECQRQVENASKNVLVSAPDLWIPAGDSPSIASESESEGAPATDEIAPQRKRGRPRSRV